MAAIQNLLTYDLSVGQRDNWQVCKTRSVAQTALTVAKLTQNLRTISFDEATVDVMDVSSIAGLRLQPWGVASDDNSCVLDFYGWQLGGGGMHIGKLTCTFGNFTSAATTGFHTVAEKAYTHPSILSAFDTATAYRGCDTIVATNDYESAFTVYTAEANFPTHAVLSFAAAQYKYLAILATTLTGATNVGCICRALALKGKNTNPDGLT